MTLLGAIKTFTARYPIVRGMVTYSVLWPTGSVMQQVFEGRSIRNFDWKQIFRYSVYGAFVVAPTLYGWVRLSSAMWPATNLKVALKKTLVEQTSYAPFSIFCFYVGMNLLEGNGLAEGFSELNQKFWPTLKVGLCIWPFVQTINFSVVPERNRVIFVSIIGVMWTTFLAYMKHLDDIQHMENISKGLIEIYTKEDDEEIDEEKGEEKGEVKGEESSRKK